MPVSAAEGHSWRLRLTDETQLEIYASLRGPDLPALTDAMDAVLASVTIEAGPAATP
jgi:hypothetical protein